MGIRPQRPGHVSAATAQSEQVVYKMRIIFRPSTTHLAMTSEQAAELIDHTLDQVHQRLQDLQDQCLSEDHQALAEEFREWRHPTGGHIDLMVFPGLANS